MGMVSLSYRALGEFDPCVYYQIVHRQRPEGTESSWHSSSSPPGWAGRTAWRPCKTLPERGGCADRGGASCRGGRRGGRPRSNTSSRWYTSWFFQRWVGKGVCVVWIPCMGKKNKLVCKQEPSPSFTPPLYHDRVSTPRPVDPLFRDHAPPSRIVHGLPFLPVTRG